MKLPAWDCVILSLPVRYKVIKGNTNIPTELTIVTANNVYKGFGKPLYTPKKPVAFLFAEVMMLPEIVFFVSIPIFVVCSAQRAEPLQSY